MSTLFDLSQCRSQLTGTETIGWQLLQFLNLKSMVAVCTGEWHPAADIHCVRSFEHILILSACISCSAHIVDTETGKGSAERRRGAMSDIGKFLAVAMAFHAVGMSGFQISDNRRRQAITYQAFMRSIFPAWLFNTVR